MEKLRQLKEILFEVEKAIETIMRKYPPEIAGEFTSPLIDVAFRLKDKNVVGRLANSFTSDKVVNALRRYKPEEAKKIIHSLGEIAKYSESQGVDKAAEIIEKYDVETAKEFLCQLDHAYYRKAIGEYKGDVGRLAESFTSDKVVNTIRKYEPKDAEVIARSLAEIGYYSEGYKDVVDGTAEIIGKCDAETAKRVASKLLDNVRSLSKN